MKINYLNLLIGIVLGLTPLIIDFENTLNHDAKIVLTMMIIMIFFWLSEAIPSSITALFPIIFSPFLCDVSFKELVSKYASPVVFLLLGGFLISQGFEKSKFHKRLAMKSIIFFGNTKLRLLFCTIFSTAFFSMWISNTATCLLMLPICKFLIDNAIDKNDTYFAKILLLSIAYSSSIGGMITPIGTIPNAILVGFLNDNYGLEISFIGWVKMIFPIAFILLLILGCYFSLRLIHNNHAIDLRVLIKKYSRLGKIKMSELVCAFIITITAFMWIFKNKINSLLNISLTDPIIAIIGGILFFVIPVNSNKKSILGADSINMVSWDVLVLFGGGLSMAFLVVETGLSEIIANQIIFIQHYDILLVIFLLTLFTSLLTEFTSNTATTFLLLPLFASFAIEADIQILKVLLPVVLAASCAFMMPISTPPNAIVYSTKKISIKFMSKIGMTLNILSIIMISVYIHNFIFTLE